MARESTRIREGAQVSRFNNAKESTFYRVLEAANQLKRRRCSYMGNLLQGGWLESTHGEQAAEVIAPIAMRSHACERRSAPSSRNADAPAVGACGATKLEKRRG